MIHKSEIDVRRNDDTHLDTAVKNCVGEGRIITLQFIAEIDQHFILVDRWVLVWED